MARNPPRGDDGPALQTVLDALDDGGCREIVRALAAPLSAKEVAERCDIPLTTTYRKLDLLESASLVDERTEIRTDGHHTSRYRTAFEEVRVALDESREFGVAVNRPTESADARLAEMWSAVRRET